MHSFEVCSLKEQQWNQTEWNETMSWIRAVKMAEKLNSILYLNIIKIRIIFEFKRYNFS